MIPEYQTWQKGADIVHLEKNHGSGDSGYYVDVQGSQAVKSALRNRLDGFSKVKCQDAGAEKSLTVREVSSDFQGAAILELIGAELSGLGYEQIK